jgi:hypothetical protein
MTNTAAIKSPVLTSAITLPTTAIASLMALLSSAPILEAQTLSTWSGGTGSWLDAASWSPNGVPNGATADVVVDGAPGTASVVTFGRNDNSGTSFRIGRLRIEAGDTVRFGSASSTLDFWDKNAFPGAGSLILDGTLALPWSSSYLRGAKSVTGSGTMLLGSPGQTPEIYDALTNAATIRGSAHIGRANASNPPVNNSGLIEANLSGQFIDFHGQGGLNSSVNTGTLQAVSAGKMHFGQGTWLNSGGIVKADGPDSLVSFYRGGTMEGGTISATNGGVLQVGGSFPGVNGSYTFKNVTLNGPINLVQNLLISGTLTNTGRMSIPSGARLEVAGSAGVTINGAETGEIVLDAPEDDGPELIDQGNSSVPTMPWMFDDVKVRGRGNVGYRQSGGTIDNVIITNQGTFEADVDGQPLRIDVSGFENGNGGVLRATGSGNNALGGILRLAINRPLINTGGTIEALNGGRVEAAFARIEGGLIRNGRPNATPAVPPGFIPLANMTIVNPTGSGSVPLDPNGMILEGDLTLGAAGVDQNARLVGEIKNSGTLRIAASGGNSSYLRMGEAATGKPEVKLTGGGQVILGTFADGTLGNDNAGLFENLDGNPQGQWQFNRPFHNVDNTIRGFGRLGGDPSYGDFLSLTNSGTITADVPDKTLRVGIKDGTNTGVIRSENNGILNLRTTGLANTGGVLEALNESPFNFTGTARINGGTIRNVAAPSGARNFDLANATLENLTLQGPFTIRDTGGAGMAGTIQNEGRVQLLNSSDNTRTRLRIGSSSTNSVTLDGPGEVILGDPAMGGSAASVEAGNGTTNPTLTINQTMRGFGAVGYDSSTDRVMHLVNNGSISADVSGRRLSFVPRTLTNSPGRVIRATGGGELYFNPVTLTNTGATIRAESASKQVFDGNMVLDGGTVETLSGGTMEFLRQFTAKGGAAFANAGTALFGAGNGNVTFEGLANGGSTFNNTGTIRKTNGGDYKLRTNLVSSGAMTVEGGLMRNVGGGTITGGTHTAAAGTHLTYQEAGTYTFSGISTFTGAGTHWLGDGVTVTLANAAAEMRAENINLNHVTLNGLGLLSHSGQMLFPQYGINTISGTRIRTLAGATAAIELQVYYQYGRLNLTDAASWENAGTIVFRDASNSAAISGTEDTLIINQPGGVIRNEDRNSGTLDIPTQNNGTVASTQGRLVFVKPTSWTGGAASIATGAEIWINNTTLTTNGPSNTSTGAGWMQVNGSGSLALPAGSRLTADRIGFWDTSSISGPGELRVQFAAEWNLPSNVTQVINGSLVNLLLGSTNQFIGTNRTLRLQNQALMRNAGTMTFRAATQLKLESNSVYENAGITEFNPSGTGNLAYAGSDDGTGLFRTLEGSITRFIPNNAFRMSFGVPVEFAGQVYANDGYQVTFAQGGLLKSTAKLWPNHPSSSITFAGAAPLRVQGQTNEFSGTGIVRFSNTRLSFEDPSADPADDPLIAAGATVGFVDATNVVEGNGLLSGTQFTFAGASTTINQATLQNSQGWNSNWIATGGTLTLQNGARFLNEGIFNVSTRIGSWTGSAGTLFHNQSTGRFVHDTSTATVIALPFQNDGILEVRAGTLNFSSSYTGTGGVAASNGAKLTLPLGSTALGLLPGSLQVLGAGSEINVTFPSGDKLTALEASGGRLVAAGGGNLVAAGGGNILSHNGGVLVAAGGMNLVAAGGGNITVAGANSRIEGSGSLVAAGGGNVLSHNGGTIVAAGGLNADGPGNVIATGAGSLVQASSIVAAGGMNIVAAGGGNIVAAGGLNGSAGAAPQARMASFGEAPSSGPSTITVDTGSRLAGDGTFEGQGQVMNGSSVNPGFEALGGSNLVGAMQWNGSLEISAGASLNLQLGGTTAGTQHDLLNVSQAFVMNGTLVVTFVNGLGATITSANTFDVAVAAGGITSSLAGTRIPIANAYGTFLVTLVNGGTTLRLSDYQLSAPIFSQWATIQGLSGADADPLADPFHTGTSNLMKYALGLSPQSNGSPISTGTWEDLSGQQFLTISYTRPQGSAVPSDITYEPQRSTSLAPGSWLGGPTQMQPVGTPVPGPGDLETITVRSMHPIGPASPSEFLRLRVEQVPLAP